MSKRLAYIVIGAAILVALELVLDGIQYTNPPDWFYPVWIVLWILFRVAAIPAHLVSDSLTIFLNLPLLVKPTFADMDPLRIALILGADAIEGALLGWLGYFILKKSGRAT